MADRKTLEALLVRVERAGGEDREADCLLWAALLAGRSVEYLPSGQVIARRTPSDEITLGFVDPGEHSRNFYTAGDPSASIPRYTSSIDAALALVERLLPRVYLELEGPLWDATVWWLADDARSQQRGRVRGYKTAPLAILAALLMALMQMQDENV